MRSVVLVPAPRQPPADLDLERETEEGADQHQKPQHPEVLQRRFDRDRSDDVGDDEHLEPQQDRAAQVRAQAAVGVTEAESPLVATEQDSGDRAADDQYTYTDRLDDAGKYIEEGAVVHMTRRCRERATR